MKHYHNILIVLCCFLVASCEPSGVDSSNLEDASVNIAAADTHQFVIGGYCVPLTPQYDTTIIAHETRTYALSRLSHFEVVLADTIPLPGYLNYYDGHEGYTADAIPDTINALIVGTFHGVIQPDSLVKNLKSQFKLISPIDDYEPFSLLLEIYRKEGIYELGALRGGVGFPLNDVVVNDIKALRPGDYVVLHHIDLRSSHNHRIQVFAHQCWQLK